MPGRKAARAVYRVLEKVIFFVVRSLARRLIPVPRINGPRNALGGGECILTVGLRCATPRRLSPRGRGRPGHAVTTSMRVHAERFFLSKVDWLAATIFWRRELWGIPIAGDGRYRGRRSREASPLQNYPGWRRENRRPAHSRAGFARTTAPPARSPPAPCPPRSPPWQGRQTPRAQDARGTKL